jgi:hypothetical protein
LYGLDAKVDLSFLIGAELEQVAIGEYQIQFNFDGTRSLSVENAFAISDNGARARFEGAPAGAAAAVSLLGRKVVSEIHTNSGDLRLEFEGNGVLELADGSTQYESYQITHGEEIYVV